MPNKGIAQIFNKQHQFDVIQLSFAEFRSGYEIIESDYWNIHMLHPSMDDNEDLIMFVVGNSSHNISSCCIQTLPLPSASSGSLWHG